MGRVVSPTTSHMSPPLCHPPHPAEPRPAKLSTYHGCNEHTGRWEPPKEGRKLGTHINGEHPKPSSHPPGAGGSVCPALGDVRGLFSLGKR